MTSVMQKSPRRSAEMTSIARRSTRMRRRLDLKGWLLSMPTIVVLTALAAVPVITVFIGALSADGAAAFMQVVRDPSFGRMMWNTLLWIVICLVGALVCGYLLALALNAKQVKLTGMWRSLLLIPWITPNVVAATAWKWVFGRDFGTLNGLLQSVGLVDEPVSWLTDPYLVLPAVALVQVWCTFPFVMLMVTSGLQAISEEVYEAAKLDGANAWHTFRHIILPALRDVTFILVLIVTVWALNAFLPVWVITKGGPAGASTILPVALYQAFQNGSVSSVAVIALFQLVISMTLAWFYVRRSLKDD